jgi:uncharacterized protein
LMRGTMREMHLGGTNGGRSTAAEAAAEISELRSRILRNATEVPPMPPVPRRQNRVEPSQAPIEVRDDFRGIMGGTSPRAALPPPRQAPAPNLRRQSIHDDLEDVTYQPAPPRHVDPYAATQRYEEQTYYEEQPEPNYGYSAPQPRLMSSQTEAATETAFRQLYQNLFARHAGDRSIEDMTREMLRGMLQQWLDDNLPPLVERLVREEISRVARNGR